MCASDVSAAHAKSMSQLLLVQYMCSFVTMTVFIALFLELVPIIGHLSAAASIAQERHY